MTKVPFLKMKSVKCDPKAIIAEVDDVYEF